MAWKSIFKSNVLQCAILCSILFMKGNEAGFCVASCLRSFVNNAEEIINMKDYIHWQQNINGVEEVVPSTDLKSKIETMCRSYSSLKRCTNKCYIEESTDVNFANGFANLEDICQIKYKEILKYLPCLAKNERTVIKICRKQANETADALEAMQKAAESNNFSNLNALLVNLCKSTNDVLICMTPVTENICGRNPSELFKTLVHLGFKNTEVIYKSLGFDNILPEECKSLGKDIHTESSQSIFGYDMVGFGSTLSAKMSDINDNNNDKLKVMDSKGTWIFHSKTDHIHIFYVLNLLIIWTFLLP